MTESKVNTEEKNEDVNVNPDVMPEPDDDVEVNLESADPAEEPAKEEDPQQKQKEVAEKSEFDSARDDIAALYRANRDAEILADKGESSEPEHKEETSEKNIEEKQEEIIEESDPDPLITLKIDGIIVKRSQSELIAIAQKVGAGDNRLREANILLDEMKALKDAGPEDKPGDDVSSDADEPKEPDTQTTGIDSEKISEIAEQLQVGDQDDAVKAVSSLLELAQQANVPDQSTPALDAAQRRAEYKEFIVQENTEREFQESLDNFGVDFPEIAKDPELHQVSISAAARVMREEMAEKNLLSEAELSQLASDPGETANVFRQFKNAGTSLRPYSEVFKDVGEHVTEKFIRALNPEESPSTTSRATESTSDTSQKKIQERTELKRVAQQQPRQAAVRSQPDKGPKPKTSAEIVEEMRASRNYPSNM